MVSAGGVVEHEQIVVLGHSYQIGDCREFDVTEAPQMLGSTDVEDESAVARFDASRLVLAPRTSSEEGRAGEQQEHAATNEADEAGGGHGRIGSGQRK